MTARLDPETAATLAAIHAEARAWGEGVEPPASEAALAALAATLRAAFDAALPDAWAAFLRAADGLDFDGTRLYATRERNRPPPGGALGGDPLWTPGIAEQTLAFRAGPPPTRPLLLLGSGNGGVLVAQDLGGGREPFGVFDAVSLDPVARFPDAAALLRHVLREAFRR